MRIIAGLYRGRVLKSPVGLKTRPTSDRLRETLFNVLQTRIDDETAFLDLCAGTGAVGIEALSRGAAHATFIDKSRKACALIEQNLDQLAVPETQTDVVQSAADEFLRKSKQSWNVIYFDPPYDDDYRPVLWLVADEAHLLAEDGLFIAEHRSTSVLPDTVGSLRRWRILRQGDASLSFYERS